ncbi:MAG: CotH kinase family protein [Bacteroidetes bacterium]|nr:CotH kinase family protein [Bacteroidota bacterium]
MMKSFLCRLLSAFLLLLPGFLSAQDFFGNNIQEVKVDLPFKNWDIKLDSIKKINPEARLTGTAWVNGVRFDSIGIRYKGNSSYFRTRNETYKKLPVNIKLDYKIKTQKLKDGYNTIKLSNAFLDPSFIRDPLAYEVIRKYMPAPLCNFAKLYLNNTFYGLFVSTESIDPLFIKKHFDTNTGYLVKCDPDNWKRVRSQAGCPKGENASLTYLNDNSGCYDAFYEVDNPGAWKPLLNLIKVLNKNPNNIETVLDVDQTLWMLALNNTLVNLDSYNGSLSHNYYLWFDTTGVAHPLIWDLNMAFGGWRRNFSFEEMTEDQLVQYHPLAEVNNPKRPLISKLLSVPLYRKVYLSHVKTIVADYLQNKLLLTRAQAMMKDIDSVVKQDTMKLYSYTYFQNALDKTQVDGPDHIIGIWQLMGKRADFLAKHPLLLKPQPLIAEVQHAKSGGKVKVSAKITGANTGWLMYRKHKSFAFSRTAMTDDGANGDAKAGDGIFTALVDASLLKHYYVVAEGEESASCYPEKASYAFLKVD